MIHNDPRGSVTPESHAAVVRGLRLAAAAQEADAISAMMHPAVELVTDGGGVVFVDQRTARGPAAVTRRLCALLQRGPIELTEQEVNGRSGLALQRAGEVVGIVSVKVDGGLITHLWVVLNPDKLRGWNQGL